MNVVSVTQGSVRRITGSKSDGSDRVVTMVPTWYAKVTTDAGVEYNLEFDHNPTDQDIANGLPRPQRMLMPTAKGDLALAMASFYADWWRWRQTELEATRRGLAAAIITALTTQENASWANLLTAINAWRLAP